MSQLSQPHEKTDLTNKQLRNKAFMPADKQFSDKRRLPNVDYVLPGNIALLL